MMRIPISTGLLLMVSLAVCAPAYAGSITVQGIVFPQGAASFADSVYCYAPVIDGSGNPSIAHRVPSNALGLPDYDDDPNCDGDPGCTFVSLGLGGSIVLKFTDNLLSASGDSSIDLWVFEVGPLVEDMDIWISQDASDPTKWLWVGGVGGSTAGIDIDANINADNPAYGYDYDIDDLFSYVLLTDYPDAIPVGGPTIGADIDAVGAISTSLVPEPSFALLLGVGFGAVFLLKWRFSA